MEFYNFVEVSTLKNLRKYNISEGFGDRVFIGGEQSVALALVGVYVSDVKFGSVSFELNSPIPLHYIDFWAFPYGSGLFWVSLPLRCCLTLRTG